MTAEAVATMRAQAAHARELAVNMHNRQAENELREIAAKLDAEADAVEDAQISNRMPPPFTNTP